MEGIGAEAASLAGHLKLSNLCWFYDNNRITIEGSTSLAFSEDVPARFAGLGWAVQHVTDANDLDALGAAIEAFKAETSRPTLDRGRQRHRLRRPAQAGHPRRARRAARGRRGRGDQAVLPVARRPGLPRPGPGPRALRRRHARQRWPGAPRVGGAVRPLRRRAPRPRRPAQPHAAPHAARRLGRRPAAVPGRRQGPGRARLQRQGAQRGRGAGAVDDRRIVGPGAVEQVAADLRRRGRLQRRRPAPGATCTSGSASTPPPRSATGSPCPSCAPTRPGSSSSPTSSAARCGSPR